MRGKQWKDNVDSKLAILYKVCERLDNQISDNSYSIEQLKKRYVAEIIDDHGRSDIQYKTHICGNCGSYSIENDFDCGCAIGLGECLAGSVKGICYTNSFCNEWKPATCAQMELRKLVWNERIGKINEQMEK